MVDTYYYHNSLDDSEIIAFTIAEYFHLNPYDVYKMDYEKQMKMYGYVKEMIKHHKGGGNSGEAS